MTLKICDYMCCGNGTKREPSIKESLGKKWYDICNDYLREFCERHEIDAEYEISHGLVWVANEPGTIAEVADMFVHMDEIRYDVDNDIDPDYFMKWYWNSVERAEYGVKYMNYESFCKGCPDPIPPEQFEKIKKSRKRLVEAQKLFEESMADYKDPKCKSLELY